MAAPWNDPRVARFWLALANPGDPCCAPGRKPGLCTSEAPKLLVWDEDDVFQTVDCAERFANLMPNCKLVGIRSAPHIPRLKQ
jgi:hypothetical protein